MRKKIINKAIKKAQSKRLLNDVPPENYFYVCNGRILKNVNELRDELTTMDDGTYSYHANQEKNDFSNWITDIVKDKKLANNLRKASKKQEALAIIERRISKL